MGKDALFKHSQRKRERQVESTNKLVSEMGNRYLIEDKEKVKAANIEAAAQKTDVHNHNKLKEQARIVGSNYHKSMKKADQKLSELEKHLDNVYEDIAKLKTCEDFPETNTKSFQTEFEGLCKLLALTKKEIIMKRANIQKLKTPITRVTEGLAKFSNVFSELNTDNPFDNPFSNTVIKR